MVASCKVPSSVDTSKKYDENSLCEGTLHRSHVTERNYKECPHITYLPCLDALAFQLIEWEISRNYTCLTNTDTKIDLPLWIMFSY